MKKEQLIEKLAQLPAGVEVCIFDHSKNLHHDCGDGSAEGIYKEFEVEYYTGEDIKEGCNPFAVLLFENEDYETEE